MSLLRLVVIALASLFLFAGFAVAGKDEHPHHKDKGYKHHKIFAPKCHDGKWKWTYNSLGQHPCKVAAYLLSTCHGGAFSFPGLSPGGTYGDASKIDLCECNTVVYSLLSACEACQGGKWPYYKEYVKYCDKVLPPTRFPHPVPHGTKVPLWAFIDVTTENNWDPAKAAAVGDLPEAGPGTNLA